MKLSKISVILSWLLAILLAIAYLGAAAGKLTGGFTQAFVHWGYPAWFATLIGVLELAGAIGLLIPKTTKYAVLGLTVIMLGAIYTHLVNHEGPQVLQPIIFLALLWAVWVLRRVSRRPVQATVIKSIVILLVVLGWAAVNRMNETIAAAAQANSSQNPAAQEEKPFDQQQALADWKKKIAGQENKPAEEVFKNIQIPLFKKLPANLLLGAMELVFSKSLGVDCRHCHVVEQWEKDEKPTKQTAREMYALMLSIQGDLRKMSSLKSRRPVTCYTCHRGQTKPEFELPEAKKKQ